MNDQVDQTARAIAERGRDALIGRLRPAFEEAARMHADVLPLSDEQLEEMIQRAADRADGLQWRRALAAVATEQLGIGLGEALAHPAVARAQEIVGAPSYEETLANLGTAPASNGDEPSTAAVVAEGEGEPRYELEDEPRYDIEPEVQEPEAAAEPEVQEPEAAAEPEVQEPEAAAEPEIQEPDDAAEPEIQEPDAEPEVQEPEPEPEPEVREPDAEFATEVHEPQPDTDFESNGALDTQDALPEPETDSETDGDIEVEDAPPEPEPEDLITPVLTMTAIHIGGIANLPADEGELELRLSDDGLDIAQGGVLLGRLVWRDIERLEVASPRGVRRRKRRDPQLVVRTAQGEASFQMPGLDADDLRERLGPVLDRHRVATG